MDQHVGLNEGIQLRLTAIGETVPHGQRLTVAGIHDVARLILYHLNTLDSAGQRDVLRRALRILDERE